MFKKLVLCLCLLSLSACATRLPNGKIDPTYGEIPIRTKIAELQVKQPLTVTVPVGNLQSSGGGLLGALLVTAVNVTATTVSHVKRRDKTKEIKDSISANDGIYDLPGKTYIQTLRQANWLKIEDVEKFESMELPELRRAGEQMRVGMEGKTVGMLGVEYVIGDSYESLTQRLRFLISRVEKGKTGKTVYEVTISDNYYPEGWKQNDLEQYKIWIANDNAILRKAIRQTTARINKELTRMIKDPYVEIKDKNSKK